MRLLRYILFVLLLPHALPGLTQVTYDENVADLVPCELKLNKRYIKSYFTDSWHVLGSPARWKGRQWLTAVAVSGVSILVYSQDDWIRDMMQRNHVEGLDQASKYFFGPLGSWMVTVPISAGLYAWGAIAKDQRANRAGLAGLKAMAITAVFTYAIKYSAQRHRPYDDDPPDPRIWEGPFGSYESTSFPSGHASVTWALATVIASEYSDRLWVPILSYSFATLASASRVYDDEHWASDVIIGAALGFFIGKFVYKSTAWCPDLQILPGTSMSGHPGFIMSYQLK